MLDANVFISAFMKKGSKPYDAMIKAFNDFETIVPEQFVNDIYSFAKQAKKKKVKINPDEFLVMIEELKKAELIEVVEVKKIISISDHEADNHYISAAIENNAEILITGDKDLTCERVIEEYSKIGLRVVRPSEFLEMF